MIELLRRFGGKFRRYMVIGPACKLIEVIFDLLTPLVIAQMIDKGIDAHDVSAVVHYGMVLGAMAVIGISFTLVCQKMAALTSQGMGTDICGALYQHINELSYVELDRFGTPSLITRITNDVNQVQLAVALGVRMLIRWPFLAVGSMVAALAIDLKLGMIFLICTPAIGLVFWFVMARCIPYYKQLQAKLDRIEHWLPDTQTLISWGEYCRDMGLSESGAREIIAMKPLYVSGELRAPEYSRRFDVSNTEIRLQRDPNGPGGFQLLIDRQPAHAWFRQRYVELMTRLGYPVRPERPVIRRHTIKR